MSSKPSSWRQLAASLWSHSFGPIFGSTIMSSDDHQMDTDADDQELQRNREVEAELATMGKLARFDPTGDSLTNENDLSPITPELVQSLYYKDVKIQEKAMRQFRKLLSDTPKPLCDEIIKSGAVPRFVHFLKSSRYPKLQFESASVLAYITGGNSALTQVIIDAGAVPVLIKLLTASSNKSVIEDSVLSLGNIARVSAEYRDLLLNSNVLPPLLGLFNKDKASLPLMRYATLTLRILCGDKNSRPNFAQVSQCLPLLARLIVKEDGDILYNVCLALYNLCDGSKEQIQAVIESGVCPRAVQLLSHNSDYVVNAVLLLVCAITLGDDSQRQVIITFIVNANAVPAIGSLLAHENERIVKNACGALSKITAGTEQQIQAVIDANIIPSLIELLHHRDTEICQIASWAINYALCKAFNNGNEEQVVYIVETGAIPSLCKVLSEMCPFFTEVVLQFVFRTGESLAKAAGSTVNPYAALVEECGGPEEIQKLSFLSSATKYKVQMASKPSSWRQLAASLWSHSFGLLIGSHSDDQELQRNRQVEAELALTGNLAISDPTGGSFTNEKDLSSLTPELVQALYTEDVAIQIQATRKICKLVSDTPNPLCDEIIKSGTVPRFVHFLEDTRYPELQFESASVLNQIVSGNSVQTRVVIDAGAVPILIRLLSSSNADVIEKSLQALGNIARKSAEFRFLVLNGNVLTPLLGLFNDDNASLSLLCSATTILRNMYDKKPSLNFKQVSQCIPHLARLMVKEGDEEVLLGVCLTLTRFCEGSNEQIQVVVDSGVCSGAIQLLSHSSTDVVKEAILLLRMITSRDDSQIQVLINENALPALGSFLSHEMEAIVKDACRTLCHMTSGKGQQIQAVIDANIIPSLRELLHHEDLSVCRLAAKVLSNAIEGGSDEQIVYIADAGAILPLGKVLSEIDPLLTENLLQKVLSTENAPAILATMVKQCADLEEITFLSFLYLKVKEMVLTIIRMFFGPKLEHISD